MDLKMDGRITSSRVAELLRILDYVATEEEAQAALVAAGGATGGMVSMDQAVGIVEAFCQASSLSLTQADAAEVGARVDRSCVATEPQG